MSEDIAFFRGMYIGLIVEIIGAVAIIDIWQLIWIALPQ